MDELAKLVIAAAFALLGGIILAGGGWMIGRIMDLQRGQAVMERDTKDCAQNKIDMAVLSERVNTWMNVYNSRPPDVDHAPQRQYR